VVGYVGYALKEPWGQPRAVIGFSAEEAERLAEFLEHDGGDYGVIDRGALARVASDSGVTEHKSADRGLELAQQVPDQQVAQVLDAAPAVGADDLAVTSQLSGSQLGHSFLPGSGARLNITRAGQLVPL